MDEQPTLIAFSVSSTLGPEVDIACRCLVAAVRSRRFALVARTYRGFPGLDLAALRGRPKQQRSYHLFAAGGIADKAVGPNSSNSTTISSLGTTWPRAGSLEYRRLPPLVGQIGVSIVQTVRGGRLGGRYAIRALSPSNFDSGRGCHESCLSAVLTLAASVLGPV